MDPRTDVLDISSDEDVDSADNFDWISELLDRDTDDSEDVVVLGEVLLNPKPRFKSSTKDLDDDCVVLDGDPDKPVEIHNDNSVADSDDLLVVGEKGQVACRDYPHARHLCAKYPFTSTSHESHCHQCHCYVCDSLAPCIHWGLGLSSIDHCHATDKEEYWKIQRKCLKNCDKSPPSVLKAAPDTSPSMRLPQRNQVSPSTLLEPNYGPHGQVFRPTSVRVCSMSTTLSNQNNINQARSPQSGYIVPKNKFQPNLVSQQLLSTRNNIKRHNIGNLGPRLTSPHAAFKRTGPIGVTLPNNRLRYGIANNNYASHFSRNPHPVATPSYKNPTMWQNMPESNTHLIPNMGRIFADSATSQPQVSSQSNVGSLVDNLMPSLPQESSQVNTAYSFVTQPLSSQSIGGGVFVNSVSSQPEVSSQPYVGDKLVNSVHSQPQVSSHNTFPNSLPSQSQIYNQPVPLSNDSQTIFHQGNQSQSGLDPGFTDFNLSWVNPAGQSNQEPPAENSQLEGVAPTYDTSPAPEFPHEFIGSNPDEPGLLDFQYDSWMFDNQPISVVPSGLNVHSPEPGLIDASAFFDL